MGLSDAAIQNALGSSPDAEIDSARSDLAKVETEVRQEQHQIAVFRETLDIAELPEAVRALVAQPSEA
jgi:hypothetical protein